MASRREAGSLAGGGTVALAGEYGAGLTVVMEELVRRLSGGADPVSLFLLMPPFSAEWPGSVGLPFSVSGSLKRDGYSDSKTLATVRKLLTPSRSPVEIAARRAGDRSTLRLREAPLAAGVIYSILGK